MKIRILIWIIAAVIAMITAAVGCVFAEPLAFPAIHYKNISKNSTSQGLFDKGMLNYYGYLYAQAEYDFRQALIYDPLCGMCYWGLAISKKQEAIELGRPFASQGYDEIQKAMHLIPRSDNFEFDIVEATRQSFSLDAHLSSYALQNNYIKALQKLYKKYKNNPEWREESLALLVDAISYLSGLNDGLDTTYNGQNINKAYRKEALALLKPVLSNPAYPDHPGLLHTYIHLNERDLKDPLNMMAAQKLSAFSDGMIAHYAHMPTHIYWRRGMYDQAIQANYAAIGIDLNYFRHGGAGLNSYYYEYHYLHSYHFLTALGILTDQFDLAIKNARSIKNLMDVGRMSEFKNYRDLFFSLEHIVLARFDKWKNVLKLKVPEQTGDLGLLFINFTKGLSYLHLGNEKKFNQLYQEIKNKKYTPEDIKDFQTLMINYLRASQMAMHHASLAEIERMFRKNNTVKIEDKLFAQNPPTWFFPWSLFLSDIAFERKDSAAIKYYHDIYEKSYPGSQLGHFKMIRPHSK